MEKEDFIPKTKEQWMNELTEFIIIIGGIAGMCFLIGYTVLFLTERGWI